MRKLIACIAVCLFLGSVIWSYKYKLVGVRAAYRAIFANDETIHGPQTGFFIQW